MKSRGRESIHIPFGLPAECLPPFKLRGLPVPLSRSFVRAVDRNCGTDHISFRLFCRHQTKIN